MESLERTVQHIGEKHFRFYLDNKIEKILSFILKMSLIGPYKCIRTLKKSSEWR